MRSIDVYVFDVDDTLIDTTAQVLVKDHNGNILARLGSRTYNERENLKTEEFFQPGIHFDYSEFDSLEKLCREPKRITFYLLENLVRRKKNRDTFILTARNNQAILGQWLESNHIHLPGSHIITGGNKIQYSSTGIWKREQLLSELSSIYSGYDLLRIHIYEDDENCRSELQALEKYGPRYQVIPEDLMTDGIIRI